MTDLYTDTHAICDMLADLAEKAHKQGLNVEPIREAHIKVWNFYAEMYCPDLMYIDLADLERDQAPVTKSYLGKPDDMVIEEVTGTPL